MSDDLINRLARRTSFTYGQISAYIARVGAGVPDLVLIYNIMEAAAMNLDLDILGAPQPVPEDFGGAGIF